MTCVRIKGFKIYKDRHGKLRCYHRSTGTPIDLQSYPVGSAEFLAACEQIARTAKLPNADRPGTLGLLISSYRTHTEFLSLSKRTRSDYNKCFNYLRAIEDTPITRFTPPLIVRIRDKAAQDLGWKWGNYTKTCLSLLFSWEESAGF